MIACLHLGIRMCRSNQLDMLRRVDVFQESSPCHGFWSADDALGRHRKTVRLNIHIYQEHRCVLRAGLGDPQIAQTVVRVLQVPGDRQYIHEDICWTCSSSEAPADPIRVCIQQCSLSCSSMVWTQVRRQRGLHVAPIAMCISSQAVPRLASWVHVLLQMWGKTLDPKS